jgi:hypothetical protein
MNQNSQVEMLQEQINLLKVKQEKEFLQMREQFHVVASNLKPSNLIGNIFSDLGSGPKSSSLVDSTIGMTTGFLSRKFLFGSSSSPVKKAIGGLLQFGISNFVYKNSFVIKAVGGLLLQRIFNKKEKPEIEKTVIDISDNSKIEVS